MTSTRTAARSTDGTHDGTPDAAARLQALHDRLRTAVGELTSAEGWQQMLRTAAALPTYSPHNILLITSQMPAARAVCGFHRWRQLGRQVRKGEKGIAILAPVVRRTSEATSELRDAAAHQDRAPGDPDAAVGVAARRLTGFRVVHVFDISQTDGPDLLEPPEAIRLDGAAPNGLIDGLSAQIREAGFQLIRHDFDLPHPGLAGANGVTDFFAKTVLVRPDLSDAQAAKTISHELGHVLLHAPASRPAELTREQAEVEAESVAFIVTAAHGLDSSAYTVPYVAGWAGTDLTLVARTAERVLSTAKTILDRTPAAATVLLPEATRERLRAREPGTPDRAGARAPQPAASLAEAYGSSRVTLSTSGPEWAAERDRVARPGAADRGGQGRLW